MQATASIAPGPTGDTLHALLVRESLLIDWGTGANCRSKTGCQNDGLWGVQRVAISDMSLAQEPVSFVCSND